jgi:hypothetical protein
MTATGQLKIAQATINNQVSNFYFVLSKLESEPFLNRTEKVESFLNRTEKCPNSDSFRFLLVE